MVCCCLDERSKTKRRGDVLNDMARRDKVLGLEIEMVVESGVQEVVQVNQNKEISR